jgi:hypothetical protein
MSVLFMETPKVKNLVVFYQARSHLTETVSRDFSRLVFSSVSPEGISYPPPNIILILVSNLPNSSNLKFDPPLYNT